MPTEVTIDASGRLVIPKNVRARHRLSAGARLTLVEEDDRLVLVPQHAEPLVAERGGLLVFRGRLTGEMPNHRELRQERLDRLAADG
jgi:AbrB family looped-hinge helix DNA binding protein